MLARHPYSRLMLHDILRAAGCYMTSVELYHHLPTEGLGSLLLVSACWGRLLTQNNSTETIVFAILFSQ